MKPVLTLEAFDWPCSDRGYVWEDAQVYVYEHAVLARKAQRFLRPKDIDGAVTLRQPLIDHPTLFRTFAALAPTEAAFAAFAGQYGLLGVPTLVKEPAPGLRYDDATGEAFSDWHAAWKDLRETVTLLDAVRALDLPTLQQWISIHPDDSATLNPAATNQPDKESLTIITTKATDRDQWQYALSAANRAERLARFAGVWLQKLINGHLNASWHRHAGVAAQIQWHPDTHFSFHLVPTSLLGALWFQCARLLTDHVDFHQCEYIGCGRWFERSLSGRRKHAQYCSTKCKVAAYRVRLAAKQQPPQTSKKKGKGRQTHGRRKTTRQR